MIPIYSQGASVKQDVTVPTTSNAQVHLFDAVIIRKRLKSLPAYKILHKTVRKIDWDSISSVNQTLIIYFADVSSVLMRL